MALTEPIASTLHELGAAASATACVCARGYPALLSPIGKDLAPQIAAEPRAAFKPL
jgi:hypothetical protein